MQCVPPEPTIPNAENCTLAELETAIHCTPTGKAYRRLFAIRMLFLGYTHVQVAELSMVTRRTLQNWIARFNDQGIDGLKDGKKPGRPRIISAEQTDTYIHLINNPQEAGETHWTARKFHGYLAKQFEHEVSYRTVVRWLHDNNFRLKVPQPWPDRQDEALRQAFIAQLRQWMSDGQIDLWYMDETGIEGDPRPRRRWAKVGEKTRITRNGEHLRRSATGMVCPRTGLFYALMFQHSDTEAFQIFLDHANRDMHFERPRNLLICDNASWHKSKSLRWGQFEPIYLPPYSPDLNPIERLWLVMKAEWFNDFIAKDGLELEERLAQALCWLIGRSEGNQTTCSIQSTL